jgi:hypothetical protein
MDDTFKIEKTGTYQNHDNSMSTFLVAGDVISKDEARRFGLVNDERANDMKKAAEQQKKQASADFEEVGADANEKAAKAAAKDAEAAAESRNKGAAPENRAQ